MWLRLQERTLQWRSDYGTIEEGRDSMVHQQPTWICREALYTIEEVKARLRMGQAVWRQFRRKGAKPIRFGRRDYITGAMVIEVFMKIAEESRQDL